MACSVKIDKSVVEGQNDGALWRVIAFSRLDELADSQWLQTDSSKEAQMLLETLGNHPEVVESARLHL